MRKIYESGKKEYEWAEEYGSSANASITGICIVNEISQCLEQHQLPQCECDDFRTLNQINILIGRYRVEKPTHQGRNDAHSRRVLNDNVYALLTYILEDGRDISQLPLI